MNKIERPKKYRKHEKGQLCSAPVPGGCGRPCARSKDYCASHCTRFYTGGRMDTPIGPMGTNAGKPKTSFVKTCPDCGVVRPTRTSTLASQRCRACAAKRRPLPVVSTAFQIGDADLAAYVAGETATSIATRTGVGPHAVRDAIRRRGVRVRAKSEALNLQSVTESRMSRLRAAIAGLGAEFGKRISAGLQGVPLSEWKGLKKTETQRLIMSPEWRAWRRGVMERDGYKCQLCGTTESTMEGHHIQPRRNSPERIFDVSNGIALCKPCHLSILRKEDQFEILFTYIVEDKARHTPNTGAAA